MATARPKSPILATPSPVSHTLPGAKLGSTAPYACADLVLVEAGSRQPCSLANAFRCPAKAQTEAAAKALVDELNDLDGMYGVKEARRYRSFHTSAAALYSAYERLDNSDAYPFLSDLAERDTANSVTLLNTLLGDSSHDRVGDGELTSTKLSESLSRYPTGMQDRWSGAIFALNPRNPDSARHFCTSAKEILADILNTEAPDAEVLSWFPDCDVTEQGTPTRRAKIHYCLDRSGLNDGALEDFIEVNINDLSVLFKDLNTGAHGPAGRFSLPQLTAIKTRVEDSIDFLCEIVT